MSDMNIYQKVNAIMGEVKLLQKDGKVNYKQTRYNYLSADKTIAELHDKLVKYGIVIYPADLAWSRSGAITHINATFRAVNIDNPEEFIDVASSGDGADTQDKGSGKAMTYAYKYALWRLFSIPAGDDPDEISTDEIEDKKKTAAKSSAKSKSDKISKAQAETIKQLCADCKLNLGKTFPTFPNLSQEQYTLAVKALKKRLEKK